MNKSILLTSIFVVAYFSLSGQDITFTQFYNTPALTNPALADFENYHFRLNHRQQEFSKDSRISNSLFYISYPILKYQLNLSSTILQENYFLIGDKTINTIGFSISPAWKLIDRGLKLNIATQIGYLSRKLSDNLGDYTTDNQFDADLGFIGGDIGENIGDANLRNTQNVIPLSLGVQVYSDFKKEKGSWNLGLSLNNISFGKQKEYFSSNLTFLGGLTLKKRDSKLDHEISSRVLWWNPGRENLKGYVLLSPYYFLNWKLKENIKLSPGFGINTDFKDIYRPSFSFKYETKKLYGQFNLDYPVTNDIPGVRSVVELSLGLRIERIKKEWGNLLPNYEIPGKSIESVILDSLRYRIDEITKYKKFYFDIEIKLKEESQSEFENIKNEIKIFLMENFKLSEEIINLPEKPTPLESMYDKEKIIIKPYIKKKPNK